MKKVGLVWWRAMTSSRPWRSSVEAALSRLAKESGLTGDGD